MVRSSWDETPESVVSAAELGLLLRRVRGERTQQSVANGAKRHHYYLHRPTLSAIECGHRLPTANELRGILYGCGQPDLHERLERARQRLIDARSASTARPLPSSREMEGTVADRQSATEFRGVTESSAGMVGRDRSGEVPTRRWLGVACVTAVTLVASAAGGLVGDSARVGVPSPVPPAPVVRVDAVRDHHLCAEALPPARDGVVLAWALGPDDAITPDRRVEVHAARTPEGGWIAWTHLARPASSVDRFWMDWSYRGDPPGRSQWRQCGPHAISGGPDSPAVRGVDSEGKARWVRACGQAPQWDRPPASTKSSFCTSWVPINP